MMIDQCTVFTYCVILLFSFSLSLIFFYISSARFPLEFEISESDFYDMQISIGWNENQNHYSRKLK